MFLLSTDIDGTIYDGPETASHFHSYWSGLTVPAILVYNSGRSVDDILNLIPAANLPEPDFIIGGVGTQIFNFASQETMTGWTDEISQGWDADLVQQLVMENAQGEIELQPAECQSATKRSWYWHNQTAEEVAKLEAILQLDGLKAQVVYSSDRDLDAIPLLANKGNAAAWLGEKINLDAKSIIVAGDSGNDASMFKVNRFSGIIVGNAAVDLKNLEARDGFFFAEANCAYGVTAGLEHFQNNPRSYG